MKVHIRKFESENHPLLGPLPTKWYVMSANGRTIRSTGYPTQEAAEKFVKTMGWTLIIPGATEIVVA
jgi:hypothetical protein